MQPFEPDAPRTRADFRFSHRLRVRWAEVDMQKIVFNAHYLMYFDTAIADYWRALALPYEEAMHVLQGDLYARKATVDYHASARMDEMIDVAIRCARIGNSSMLFEGAIFRGDAFLVGVDLVYVFADPATQTSRPVPPLLRETMQAFERGEPMCQLDCGSWAQLGEGASALRSAVFIEEQSIPAEMEWDAADASALHAVARNRLGQTVATARLLAQDPARPGVASIGRVAVHRVLRGSGWGARIMQVLQDQARERGDREVRLHAQQSAQDFYTRLGYEVCGEPFVEAGIVHVEMRLPLQG